MNRLRLAVGRFTSPIFVPLRRLLVWIDARLGTCDHQLVLQPRPCFVDLTSDRQDPALISELERKLSKDRANLVGLGEDVPDEHRHLV